MGRLKAYRKLGNLVRMCKVVSSYARDLSGVAFLLVALASTSMLMVSCSTKKNTASTRAWHSFTAHFNTMYNAEVAYESGMEAQQTGHKDNYTRLLPMYISTNKATATVGKGDYEKAIEKCEKAIKVHSIKKKPTFSAGHKMTPKDKEFRNRKEFNPYLRHSWLMLGKCQFNQGNFIEAASTFNYIIRMYSTQPEVYSVAKAWLARCYVALEWPYDAEDVLTKMRKDSVSIEGARERDNSQAAFLIQTGRYKEAIPLLEKSIKTTRGKLQRTRLKYLVGQLYNEIGDSKMAYKYLAKVVKSNPPYEMEFNARTMQAEVMPKSKFRQMIKKLQRMAKSERNKDYLDRVYFAIGNIYLNNQDTVRCLWSWEKGVEESTNNGPSKAMLLLRMGQLYWEREQYIEAQKAYQQCVGMLDKEYEEYKETERRSKILDELAPPLGDIKLQDSLQALAKLPEKDYLAAIDRVIEELKKKEKEQAKKEAQAEGSAGASRGGASTASQGASKNSATTMPGGNKRGNWYFYNPQSVMTGKQTFQRQWGQRANEDNWRRSDKAATTGSDFEEYNYDEESGDSLGMGEGGTEVGDEEQALKDSLANDPHHREYYLKQIPFTDEQLAVSNATLSEGLYSAGILEAEKLENFPLALKTITRLLTDFPDFEKKEDIYYHMFLLMGRMGNEEEAENYRKKLIEEYPEAKMSILLANPNYEMIAREGRHIEDSVYMSTYNAYMEDKYEEVETNYQFSTDNFPEGKNRAKLCFVHAMTQLYTGHKTEFLAELKELIEKYPQEEITEMAQYIVKGLQDGRLLSSDKYNASGIWGRRTVGIGADSTAVDTLSVDRYSNFNFVLAYPTNSLDEDQLLFEMARYNFTSFMVRNFEIELMDLDGISMMCIKGFLSYDEVHAYAQQLYSDRHMNTILEGIKSLLISDKNLEMLGKQYSFDDYGVFFDEKLAPLNIPDDVRIDEQTDIPFIDPDDVETVETSEEELIEDVGDDDFPFGF